MIIPKAARTATVTLPRSVSCDIPKHQQPSPASATNTLKQLSIHHMSASDTTAATRLAAMIESGNQIAGCEDLK